MSAEERATFSVVRSSYEPCEECGASLDPQQRYCVNCAARRADGANPSSRYFAMMSKKARRPLMARGQKPPPTSRAAAVAFFALLPIAVALGVVVGRSGSGDGNEEALLKALRAQEATASTAAPTTAGATTGSKAKGAKTASAKAPAKGEGKVIAKTANGTVHEVTGFKASEQKTQEDTKIVEENPEQTGDNYIKAQQNLPDVTVIGGEPGAAPAPSTGVEP